MFAMAGTMNFERARFNMVEQQVRPWEVLDGRVLDALTEIHRENFVPDQYRQLAFADLSIPLGHGESMLKPVVEGRVLQALMVQPEDEVLEIGTGSGFVSACLARLARQVVSLEINPELAAAARVRIAAAGIGNCQILTQDVFEYRPTQTFDAIAVTGAMSALPQDWIRWLKPAGRMFVIVGESPAMQALLLTRQSQEFTEQRSLFETDLAYLTGAAPQPRFKF